MDTHLDSARVDKSFLSSTKRKFHETSQHDAADELTCAICFEPVTVSTSLPCQCKVPYCLQCWDCCLAQSLKSVGQSRCPTCRSPVQVDFDPSTARVVFSNEPNTGDGHVTDQIDRDANVVKRVAKLRKQVRPVQIQILQKHGEDHPELQEIMRDPKAYLRNLSIAELKREITWQGGAVADCVDERDFVERFGELARSESELISASWAAHPGATPPCVCGSVLYRVYGSALAKKSVEDLLAMSEIPRGSRLYRRAFKHYLLEVAFNGSSGSFCDLCEKDLPYTSGVWRCQNNGLKILHPTEYDICDSCFVCHTSHGPDCFLQGGCSRGGKRVPPAQSAHAYKNDAVSSLAALERRVNHVEYFAPGLYVCDRTHFAAGLFALASFVLVLTGHKKQCSFQKPAQRLQEPLMLR